MQTPHDKIFDLKGGKVTVEMLKKANPNLRRGRCILWESETEFRQEHGYLRTGLRLGFKVDKEFLDNLEKFGTGITFAGYTTNVQVKKIECKKE